MPALSIPEAGWETGGLRWVGSEGKGGSGPGSVWGDRTSRKLTLKGMAEKVTLEETMKLGAWGLGACPEA